MKIVLSYYLLFLSIVRISSIYPSALHGYVFSPFESSCMNYVSLYGIYIYTGVLISP